MHGLTAEMTCLACGGELAPEASSSNIGGIVARRTVRCGACGVAFVITVTMRRALLGRG